MVRAACETGAWLETEAGDAENTPPPSDLIDSASLLVTLAYLQSSDAIAPVSAEVSSLLRSAAPAQLARIETIAGIALPPYHLIRDSRRPISPLAQELLDLIFETAKKASKS